jgi:transposase-like protein
VTHYLFPREGTKTLSPDLGLKIVCHVISNFGVAGLRYDRVPSRVKRNINLELKSRECPECKSTHVPNNGHKKGKQNYLCVNCGRQFIDFYESQKGYVKKVKQQCLSMYVNGMGFRGIERITGVHNTTIMAWVKQVGERLPDYYTPETIPDLGELDELETLVKSKKIKFG